MLIDIYIYITMPKLSIRIHYIDGLVQDCSNSIANAMELLQSCTKPSICTVLEIHIIWWWKHLKSIISALYPQSAVFISQDQSLPKNWHKTSHNLVKRVKYGEVLVVQSMIKYSAFVNSLWPGDVIWCHTSCYIGWSIDLVSDSTKPLLQPILTCHH